MREWGTRHAREKKKKKEDVGIEKEKEKEEGERLGSFFSAVHNFFVPVTPAVPANDVVAVELPARHVPVAFVSASSPPVMNFLGANNVVPCVELAVVVPSPVVHSSVSPTDYSVVSSANFVPASAFISSSCIGTTH